MKSKLGDCHQLYHCLSLVEAVKPLVIATLSDPQSKKEGVCHSEQSSRADCQLKDEMKVSTDEEDPTQVQPASTTPSKATLCTSLTERCPGKKLEISEVMTMLPKNFVTA